MLNLITPELLPTESPFGGPDIILHEQIVFGRIAGAGNEQWIERFPNIKESFPIQSIVFAGDGRSAWIPVGDDSWTAVEFP